MSRDSDPQKSTIDRLDPLPSSARSALRVLSLLAPEPAARLAEQLFLTPMRFRPPSREHWWETDADALSLPFEGRQLTAWRWGWGGPTVLLVHGWAGRGLQLGGFAGPLVERGMTVVAVDLPAHGRSPGRQTNLLEWIRVLGSIGAQLGDVEAVVAHSFGTVATTLALALGEEGGSLDSLRRMVYLAPPSDLESVAGEFSRMTGFSPRVVERMRQRLAERFDFSWQDFDPCRAAATLDLPLLVVHDEEDEDVDFRHGVELVRAWPAARLHTTRGLGHRRLLRDPGVVSTAGDFLAGSREPNVPPRCIDLAPGGPPATGSRVA